MRVILLANRSQSTWELQQGHPKGERQGGGGGGGKRDLLTTTFNLSKEKKSIKHLEHISHRITGQKEHRLG